MSSTMQSKDRFPVLALAGYFKAERIVGEACEDLSRREGANGLFFTHSDHLGSSSWTTDADGRAVQHIEYLPFGEELLNQRATSYSERYTFTGKEMDEESNLYYYDARYNSSTYSQFNSVDPMSDEYPSVNPYLYCSGNPIMRIDPDGRADYYDDNGAFLYNNGVDDNKVYQQSKDGNIALIPYNTKFSYVGEVDKISLEYNAKMIYNGSHKSLGTLIVTQYVGNHEFRQKFSACSGTNTKFYTLQDGTYHCYYLREIDATDLDNASYCWDGIGFKINIQPIFDTKRSALEIHPDGSSTGRHDGTAGCIGLLGDGDQLRQFIRTIRPFIPQYLPVNYKYTVPNVPLKVTIDGNPDCYQANPVRCNK